MTVTPGTDEFKDCVEQHHLQQKEDRQRIQQLRESLGGVRCCDSSSRHRSNDRPVAASGCNLPHAEYGAAGCDRL